jgi:hypothetical protein
MEAIVLAAVSAWTLVGVVVVGLCAAAHAGDQVETTS